jgi:hypothetical protein
MSATYRILAGFRSPVCALPYSHRNLDRIHDAGRAKPALRARARYHGGMLKAVQSLRRHPFIAPAALAKTSSGLAAGRTKFKAIADVGFGSVR